MLMTAGLFWFFTRDNVYGSTMESWGYRTEKILLIYHCFCNDEVRDGHKVQINAIKTKLYPAGAGHASYEACHGLTALCISFDYPKVWLSVSIFRPWSFANLLKSCTVTNLEPFSRDTWSGRKQVEEENRIKNPSERQVEKRKTVQRKRW